jgi:hypothetical protein
MNLTTGIEKALIFIWGAHLRSGGGMSRKRNYRKEFQNLKRLQASLMEIASTLDAIEGKPHPILRKSADRLLPAAEKPRQSTLATYTEHFAATLAKSRATPKP